MTIDERLEFLLQSAESLRPTVQELTASVQGLAKNVQGLSVSVAELRGSVADLTRVVEIDGENIRRLANIAAAHQARLDDLDGRLPK